MAAEWFLARQGQQTVGPLTAQQLKQLGAEGQVQATDLVWKPGMPKWAPAGQVKGLLTASGEMPAVPAAEPVGAQEADWRTAGPPRAAVEPPAVPTGADAFGPTPPPAEEAEREPWYYGFLERYAQVGLVLGVLVCLVGFVWLVLAGLVWSNGGGGVAGVLLAVLFGVPALGLALLALVFQLALIRLAVDAARNLRALRRHGDRQRGA